VKENVYLCNHLFRNSLVYAADFHSFETALKFYDEPIRKHLGRKSKAEGRKQATQDFFL